ncbi:hypothetical protein EB796_007444 [Bugula neritina]|uniref:HD domain-containing protein n=1 Tax=Bugula neritina TaxID=10212 RepID=A0A7J7K6K8_BUGNE|nr:hypothetical protein EB796_007444 [Bugula neritina]
MRMDSRPSTSTATQMSYLLIQLSAVNYVYHGGNGTRFDHSLGVYHLAGKLVRCLKDKQPELGLTEVDCLCVELAGLCHDVGHGPFSHIFDQQILPRLGESCSHETLSVKMLDYMYTMNNNQLKQKLQAWNITEQDWEFIKSLIICEPCEDATGRGENKLFLYDIVSNKESGNDVDKWDYLLRDSHYLGLKHSFDYERILHYARVITAEGRPHICVRDKMVDTIYQLYSTRYNLHKHAYQHPVALGVA